MLAELIEYLSTKSPSYVRKMGFLYESIATYKRYLRCKVGWQTHLAETKRTIMNTASQCKTTRKALILGSGYLLDIPIEKLSEQFDEVILVDIVQPKRVRELCKAFSNVTLIEDDVTAIAKTLYEKAEPVKAHYSRFLDDGEIDFVASVNLLSQLPYIGKRWLMKKNSLPEPVIENFCRNIIVHHIEYLRQFSCTTCLITDIEYQFISKDGQQLHSLPALYGISLKALEHSWLWNIAPQPEYSKNQGIRHKVALATL